MSQLPLQGAAQLRTADRTCTRRWPFCSRVSSFEIKVSRYGGSNSCSQFSLKFTTAALACACDTRLAQSARASQPDRIASEGQQMQCSRAPSSLGITEAHAELGCTLAGMGGQAAAVHLHSGRAEIVHDGHEARQDGGVLLVLQLRAQIRAHLPDGLTRRPPHVRARVLQPLRSRAPPHHPSQPLVAHQPRHVTGRSVASMKAVNHHKAVCCAAASPPAEGHIDTSPPHSGASLELEIPGSGISAAECSGTAAWLRQDRAAQSGSML